MTKNPKMLKTTFDTNKYLKKISKSNSYFYTFLDRDNMAAGILMLRPGEEDTQDPHENDEVYYVVRGDGFLNVEGIDHPIQPAMSYFVEKDLKHHFHGNTKDLVVVYFFSGRDS